MEIRGLQNVRKGHGSVVLMNHQSSLDLCVLAYLWPVIGRATVVSKREILYIPFWVRSMALGYSFHKPFVQE